MPPRKNKPNMSLAVLVGVALSIGALLVFVLYDLVTHNIPLGVSVVVVAGVITAVAIALPARRNRRKVFSTVNALIEQHADQLATLRVQLVQHDEFGKPLLEKWHKKIDYFITEHIRPRLNAKQQSILELQRGEIANMIRLRAEAQARQSPVFKAFSERMTPTEFEAFCAERLRECGWHARLTRTTGDQGVDVIAEKNGLRVVLQCKLYNSGSVGNAAIQEVVAGKAYERADRSAVVTNSRYTRAAEQLAATNGVLLLHYSELPHLDARLQRGFPESFAHAYTADLFAASSAVDTPKTSIERAQETPPGFVPAARPSLFDKHKRVLVVGGAIVLIAIAAFLSLGGKQQKVVITGSGVTTGQAPRKRRAVPEFATYTNSNFGFSIGYPSSFVTKGTAPENGDRITLTSPDGAASLVVAGANVNGSTINELYDSSLKGVAGELGYRLVGGNWFVISWKDGHQVFYQKMFVGSGSKDWFTFTFPETQRSTYEEVITRIEKSFKPGALDQAGRDMPTQDSPLPEQNDMPPRLRRAN